MTLGDDKLTAEKDDETEEVNETCGVELSDC